jgi:hypothetical protein
MSIHIPYSIHNEGTYPLKNEEKLLADRYSVA